MTPFHHSQTPPTDGALIWPWEVNWAVPPSESLAWHTATHRSAGAREQRRSLRRRARPSPTYAYLLTGSEPGLARRLVAAWAHRAWCVPRWEHALRVTDTSGPLLEVDGDPRSLAQAGSAWVLWNSPSDITPVTVASATEASVTLSAAPASPAVYLIPCVFAHLPESSTSTVVTGTVTTLQVTFNPLSVVEDPPAYKWYSVFPNDGSSSDPRCHFLRARDVNWVNDIQSTDLVKSYTFDTEQNEPTYLPQTVVGQRSLGMRAAAFGEDRDKWRDFVLARKGQAVGFYVEHPELVSEEPIPVSSGVLSLPELALMTDPGVYYHGVSFISDIALGTLPGSSLSGSAVTGSVAVTSLPFTDIYSVTSSIPAYDFNADYLTLSPVLELGNWELAFISQAATTWKVWVRGDRVVGISDGGGALLVSQDLSTAAAKVVAQANCPAGETVIQAVNGRVTINGVSAGSYFGKGVLSVGHLGSAGFSGVVGGLRFSLVDLEGSYEIAYFSGGSVTLRNCPSSITSAKKLRMVSAARLASDSVEITHHSMGVAELNLPVITTHADAAPLEVPTGAPSGGSIVVHSPLSPYSPFYHYSETLPAEEIPDLRLIFQAPSFIEPATPASVFNSGFTVTPVSIFGGTDQSERSYSAQMTGSWDTSAGIRLSCGVQRVVTTTDWQLGLSAYFGFSGLIIIGVTRLTLPDTGATDSACSVQINYGGIGYFSYLPSLATLADGGEHSLEVQASTSGFFVKIDGAAIYTAGGPSAPSSGVLTTAFVGVSNYRDSGYLPCPFKVTALEIGTL